MRNSRNRQRRIPKASLLRQWWEPNLWHLRRKNIAGSARPWGRLDGKRRLFIWEVEEIGCQVVLAQHNLHNYNNLTRTTLASGVVLRVTPKVHTKGQQEQPRLSLSTGNVSMHYTIKGQPDNLISKTHLYAWWYITLHTVALPDACGRENRQRD